MPFACGGVPVTTTFASINDTRSVYVTGKDGPTDDEHTDIHDGSKLVCRPTNFSKFRSLVNIPHMTEEEKESLKVVSDILWTRPSSVFAGRTSNVCGGILRRRCMGQPVRG